MPNAKPLLVPDVDIPKALKDRRFPYRAAAECQVGPERAAQEREQVRAELDDILRGVENMLWKIARTLNNARDQYQFDDQILSGVVNQAMTHIWQHVAPRFDSSRHAKPSTYFYLCADRKIRESLRATIRERDRTPFNETDIEAGLAKSRRIYDENFTWTGRAVAPDTAADRKIEALADDFLVNPRKYLSGPQARVFCYVRDNPGKTQVELAKALRYKRPSSLSSILGRIRKAIRELGANIEDIEIGGPA